MNFNSGIYNADTGLTTSSRELGGLAQSQLAYDLGLSSNLNVNSDFTTPQVDSSGNITYTPTLGAPSTGGPNAGNGWSGGSVGNTPGGAPTGQSATPTSGLQLANGTTLAAPTSTTGGGATPGSGGSSPTGSSLQLANYTSPGAGGTAPGGTNPATGTGNGYGSLGNVLNASTFQQDPAYQFNLQQGLLALQRQQAAGGTQLSGSALKDAMGYASGMASNEYQNEFTNSLNAQAQTFNMLNSVANNVNTANGQVMNAGANANNTASGAYTNIGNAQANQAVANGNANSSLVNSITSGVTSGLKTYAAPTSTPAQTTTYGTGPTSALNNPNYFSTQNIQPVTNSNGSLVGISN